MPEGSYANNDRLAKGRTAALLNYVRNYYDFPEGLLTMASTPEDWAGFRKFITNSALPQKEEILQMIDLDEKDMDAKEKKAMMSEIDAIRLYATQTIQWHTPYADSILMKQKRLSIPIHNS